MSERFPGYLYAKSARIVEPAGSSYKEWFSHPALKSFEKRIEAFRNGFQWVSDSLKRHGPVVVAETAGDGIHALVVRFIDAGKDAYGRSQTLRMEVFLVPTDTSFDFIDGSFSAEPDLTKAEWSVAFGTKGGDCGSSLKRIVVGDPGTFRLSGLSPATPSITSAEALWPGIPCRDATTKFGGGKIPSPPSPTQGTVGSHKRRKEIKGWKRAALVMLLCLAVSMLLNVFVACRNAQMEASLALEKKARKEAEEMVAKNQIATQEVRRMASRKGEISDAVKTMTRMKDDMDDVISCLNSAIQDIEDETDSRPAIHSGRSAPLWNRD